MNPLKLIGIIALGVCSLWAVVALLGIVMRAYLGSEMAITIAPCAIGLLVGFIFLVLGIVIDRRL